MAPQQMSESAMLPAKTVGVMDKKLESLALDTGFEFIQTLCQFLAGTGLTNSAGILGITKIRGLIGQIIGDQRRYWLPGRPRVLPSRRKA